MRICTLCKLEKEDSEFYKRGDSGKYRPECKVCCAARAKEYNKHNQEVRRKAWKNYRCKMYGLTAEQFDQMMEEQNALCKICDGDISQKCHIDHNHSTGVVRGLLCHNCNVAIGHARESVDLLNRIIRYLENSG